MKILFIVLRPIEINSSTSIWNSAIINGLISNGHNVDVLTTMPDKRHSNYDDSLLNKKASVYYIQPNLSQSVANFARQGKLLNLVRRKLYKIHQLFKVYDIGSSYVKELDNLGFIKEKYDLMISSSDPKSSHLFALKCKINYQKATPWLQLWSDPFWGDITVNSILTSRKVKKEEKRLLKNATKISYISNILCSNRANLYPEYKEKMMYFPIPFLKEVVDKKEESDSLVFAYCGDYFSKVRNIKPFYDAINNSKHSLIICGSSDIELENTEHVTILPRVSYEKVCEIEENADVLVHLSNLSGVQIPGKIFQYSGTEKKILFILDGNIKEIQNEFSKYNRYCFVKNNIIDIENILDHREIWDRFEKSILKEYSPQYIAKKMLESIPLDGEKNG